MDWRKLGRRTLAALIYAPLFIFAIYLGSLPFFLCMIFGAVVALQEMFSIYAVSKKNIENYHVGFLFVIAMITTAYMQEVNFIWKSLPMIMFSLACGLYFLFELAKKKIFFIDNQDFFMIRAVILVGLMFSYMVLLRESSNGLWDLLYLMAIIWTTDIFAYLIGKPLGKHKLSPKVSPKKSVEGSLGALFGAVLMSISLKYLIGVDVWQAIVLALLVSVLAQSGDLIESLLKRTLNVKDSGNFMPGHGGLLDRFDSFILTVPIFYLFTNYIIHIIR